MQNTHSVLFFMAVWKRPVITEICFMGLNRLRKKKDFEALAVISEEEMIPLCEKYDVQWCMTENFPLGAKKNFGLKEALKRKFDYLIEIGSDDIFKDEFFDVYSWDRDVMALSDFIMLNTQDGECRRLNKQHAYYGTGRAISRRALDAGDLWSDALNKGLDNNSTYRLSKKGFLEKRFSSEEPVAIGLKSDVNIWPFVSRGIEYPLEKALSGLSEEEITAIKCLAQENISAGVTAE